MFIAHKRQAGRHWSVSARHLGAEREGVGIWSARRWDAHRAGILRVEREERRDEKRLENRTEEKTEQKEEKREKR